MFSSSGNRGGADQLRRNQAKLQETERLVIERDKEFQIQTERLLESVGRQTRESHVQSQEVQDVLQLQSELAAVAAKHTQEFDQQREQLQDEHEQMLHHRLKLAHEENEFASADGDCRVALDMENDAVWAECEDAAFVEQVEEAEVSNHNLIRKEELRVDGIRQELLEAHAEIRVLAQERDSEAEAASITKEVLNAERRAALRQGEMLRAEERARISEAEAARDAHRLLQERLQQTQQEISDVTHSVGQRHEELRVKNSELHEVKEGLLSIQDRMDEVNQQLQERCDHARRIEDSLQLTRELGGRVHTARSMLKESHGALAQLSCLLEQERSYREHCAQSLQQQQSQSELLMRLLQHFRSRAQELAPQALLASRSSCIGSDLCGDASVEAEAFQAHSSDVGHAPRKTCNECTPLVVGNLHVAHVASGLGSVAGATAASAAGATGTGAA